MLTKMKRPLWIFGFLLVLLSLSNGLVSAQQSTPSDDQVNAIARQLFCPICENIPLDVCPTQACHDWRELIRQMLAEASRKPPSSSTSSITTARVCFLNRRLPG